MLEGGEDVALADGSSFWPVKTLGMPTPVHYLLQ